MFLTPERTPAGRYVRSALGVRGVSDCSTVRRWNRCELDPALLACINQADHVWLCDPSAKLACPDAIKYLNACYEPTDTTSAFADIPDGDVFLDSTQYRCSTGCGDDDCTTCDAYYLAVLCAGQGPGPGVRVLVPISRIGDTQCYGFQYSDGMTAWCYTVRSGTIYAFAVGDVVHLGGIIAGYRCCDCVDGCTHFVGTKTLYCGGESDPLDCCCPDSYSFSVAMRYDWLKDDATLNVSTGIVEHVTYQFVPPLNLSGSGTVTDGGVPVWDGVGGLPPVQTGVLRAIYDNGVDPPVTNDYPYSLQLSFVGGCVPDFAQFSLYIGGGIPYPFAQVQTFCESQAPGADPYYISDNATSGRSCTIAGIQNLWHLVDPRPGHTASTETGAFLSTVAIDSSSEECGEGCGAPPSARLGNTPLLFAAESISLIFEAL